MQEKTQTFASYVASLRKKRGLSQKQLAEALGFTPQGISRFENLDSSFDLNMIDRLCSTLDISVKELCERQIEGTKYIYVDLDLPNLSSRLRGYREEKGVTQSFVSESAKITSRSLRAYESGDSLPSFQTLCRIATSLDIAPFELFQKPEKDAPPAVEIPLPVIKRRFPFSIPFAAALSFAILILISLSVGLPLGLSMLNGEKNAASPNLENSLDNSEAPEEVPSSFAEPNETSNPPYVPSYPLNQQGYPNYLSVDVPKHDFTFLGEEIEFVLYDPDGEFSFLGLKEEEITITVNDSLLDIEFTYIADGRFTANLKKGKNGAVAFIDATIGDIFFPSISFFRYVSGEVVTASNSTSFTDGVVAGPDSINLSRQRKTSANIYLYLNGDPQPKDGSLMIGINFISLPAMATYYKENVIIGNDIGDVSLEFPSPNDLVADDVYLFVDVEILDGETERFFCLAPWHLHLNK